MIQFVDAANSALPAPEREVLALLAESGLGYDGVGRLLGVERRAVAEIAARGRLRLAAVAPDGLAAACRAQLPHLTARIDGDAVASPDPGHAAACPACADALEAMREAAAAYRAWNPGGMPEVVRARIRDDL